MKSNQAATLLMMLAAMATLTAVTVPAPLPADLPSAGIIARFLTRSSSSSSEQQELKMPRFAAPEPHRRNLLHWTQPVHGTPHHRL